jgi:hypothetical protein
LPKLKKVLPIEKLENLGAALFNIPEVADLVNWFNRLLAELIFYYNSKIGGYLCFSQKLELHGYV